MNAGSPSKDPAALSYLGMRKAVGILALALPPALIGGAILLAPLGPTGTWPHPLFQGSISDYYYTPMGNFLVGSLCAIAMFLMSCRGYDWQDELAGYLACAFALGVAFCPTTPPGNPNPTALQNALGNAHEICAAAMFLVLAFFCLVLFRRTGKNGRPTPRKLLRNRVYAICGWTIVGCMVTMVSLHIPAFASLVEHINMLLIFESIALEAFGIAWLTKGEAILKDEKTIAPASAAKMKKA
jgi:hypothetical protein